MTIQFVDCPPEECAVSDLLEFALTYNGYERLAHDPEHLGRLVAPVVRELEKSGPPPDWAQLDLLRGTLFFLQRRTHHWGEVPPDEEQRMRTLVGRIREAARGAALSCDDTV